MYYVYIIKNKIDGTVYVGKSKNPTYRWGAHKSRSKNPKYRTTHFLRALYEYGFDSFELEIHSSYELEDEAYNAEKNLTIEYKSIGKRLYNEKEGGHGGHSNPTVELREKLSNSRIGEKHPLWGKQGTRLGAHNSKESIEKFKLTVKNKLYYRQGFHFSNETKELWSRQRKNKKFYGRTKLSEDEKLQIEKLFDNGVGMTAIEIAEILNRCASTVRKTIRNLLAKERSDGRFTRNNRR